MKSKLLKVTLSLREDLANKICPEQVKRQARTISGLKTRLRAMESSDKVVIISPTVKIDGLSRLKRSLFIDGDNLEIRENTINMKGHVDSSLTIMGDNSLISNNIFKVTKAKKRSKQNHE